MTKYQLQASDDYEMSRLHCLDTTGVQPIQIALVEFFLVLRMTASLEQGVS